MCACVALRVPLPNGSCLQCELVETDLQMFRFKRAGLEGAFVAFLGLRDLR